MWRDAMLQTCHVFQNLGNPRNRAEKRNLNKNTLGTYRVMYILPFSQKNEKISATFRERAELAGNHAGHLN